jgi:hypothetical protein
MVICQCLYDMLGFYLNRLYMKQKFGNENWFKDKMFPQQIMSVKEALRILMVPSLENQMVSVFMTSL